MVALWLPGRWKACKGCPMRNEYHVLKLGSLLEYPHYCIVGVVG